MNVTLRYETQLRRAIGTAAESIEVPDGTSLGEIVRTAAERHDESVAAMLLNPDGTIRASLLLFIGDQQVGPDDRDIVADGDTLTLMSPISGG